MEAGPCSEGWHVTCAWRDPGFDAGRVETLSVVGDRCDRMTNIPEAKLAREAEMCYSTIAFATDYDCWHETAGDVAIGEVLRILAQSAKTARAPSGGRLKRFPKRGTVSAHRLEACPHHGQEADPREDQEGPRAHHRQIHVMSCLSESPPSQGRKRFAMKFLVDRCWESSRRVSGSWAMTRSITGARICIPCSSLPERNIA